MNKGKNTLLTIAIPTWNRSGSLKIALEKLLEQTKSIEEYLEVVISDNGSTDSTKHVIKNAIKDYPKVNFVLNKNNINLGMYSNYRKCKEISSGKYFWFLSDDDYLMPNIIKYLINLLLRDNNITLIFLNDWGIEENAIKIHWHKKVDNNELIRLAKHRITLLSSVVFLNNKDRDTFIEEKFYGSVFLCFAYFVNAAFWRGSTIIIYGKSLIPKQVDNYSYNTFDAFVEKIKEIILYMHTIKFASFLSIYKFEGYIIKCILRGHFINYKINLNLPDGKKHDSISKIALRIFLNYYKNIFFWRYLFLLILIPRKLLIVLKK